MADNGDRRRRSDRDPHLLKARGRSLPRHTTSWGERTPIATDYLWYGVFRVGQRVIGLKPERALSYRGFYEWWKRVEATAGVRHRKPHMTRHTFATDVLDATEGDLYAVKELLGHATRVTEVYLHSSRTRTESAVRALTEYRRGNRQTEEA